jgi:hypothetical protein
MKTELGKIQKTIDNSFARGRVDALNNREMEFHVAGELASIVSPLVDRVLTSCYESRDIKFEPPFVFRKEEAVKVINGIVKTGIIRKGAKPNQNISAAQNFGFALKIVKKGAEKELDVSENPHVQDMWAFIDDKMTDQGQSMNIETIYKNFMGVGGPKDYGLARRMTQLYLLCLAKESKIRIGVGPRAGLPFAWLDYSNISEVDFSAKILDSITEIQKMAKPENWEILRPYVEKLLREEIPSTSDDSAISEYRAKLRNQFAREKETSSRVSARAKSLFETLKTKNPYETEIEQISRLFSTELESGNDIDLILYVLKEILGYQAFDSVSSSQTEVDDLANRLKNYSDVKHFIGFENELITANLYCNHRIPEHEYLKELRKVQGKVSAKLSNPQPYIDSDVKLKTELIGKTPPEPDETGTLGRLLHEYSSPYVTLHDSVIDKTDTWRRKIEGILGGEEMSALRILENITAFKPAVSDELEKKLQGLASNIFVCPNPSRGSVEEQLRRGPLHECSLSFLNAADHTASAEQAATEATSTFNSTLDSKMEIFLNPAVRERLKQGTAESVITGLLKCVDIKELRTYLVDMSLKDPSTVDVINRYLKRVAIKTIKMTDFKPTLKTIEKEQVPDLAKEFQQYLENQINEIEAGKDSLPILKLE